MNSIYFLIPIALIFTSIAIVLFFWAVKSGQYEDLNAEGKRILFDPKVTSKEEKPPK